jgi:ABC-2 type transport system permease protein
MRSVRSALRTYAVAASTSMREKLAYPGNYVASMFTYALFVFIFSRVWASAYAGKTEIAGYTMPMAIWYFIVAEVPGFGFGRFFWTLSRDMKSGQVAYLLTRPYGYVGYHFAERFGGSLLEAGLIMGEGLAVGLLFAGAPPGMPGLASPGIGMEAARVAFVIVSLLLAGILNFMLQISLAMTAFWLEENEAFFWIFQKLSLVVGTLIPIEFLPASAARIAAWTPFPYLSYAPARIAVAFTVDGALALVARQALWILVAIILAKAVFAFGSRRLSVNGG